jgi:hypothetical protein
MMNNRFSNLQFFNIVDSFRLFANRTLNWVGLKKTHHKIDTIEFAKKKEFVTLLKNLTL